MSGSLVLIRGLPGSGKTTLAKKMLEDGEADIHAETDLWFTSLGGDYRFDPEKLSENHAACQALTLSALQHGLRVVVSNTFTRRWEMQPYLDMGFPVREIVCEGDYGSVHGVPEAAIQRMRERWEA